MELNLFEKKIKLPTFSIAIFAFFLLVSLVSLHLVREKILDNSHIMGREIAARFAIKETAKIKTQEILLRAASQNMAQLLQKNAVMPDNEIEQALSDYSNNVTKNTALVRFDMSAVINGRLIGSSAAENKSAPEQLQWYKKALNDRGSISYTGHYKDEARQEYVLTMAMSIGGSDNVLAINIYPERLNELLADNKLPPQSYYYLCDANGRIMFNITDRNISLEAQQPYVDQILHEIQKNGGIDKVSYITDLDGNKRGVYYAISETGWISIVTIPYDYLMGDYQSLQEWFILTLCILLLLMALFGLREYILNRKVESVNEVVQVMNKEFLAVFRLNYKTGRYETLKAEHIGFEPEENGSYEELLQNIAAQVEDEAAEEFVEKFSLDNIKTLVNSRIHDFGGEFRQDLGKGYKWVNVRLVHDEEFLRENEAIFFFREVDAEKLKELEQMELMNHALRVARENVKSRNMFFSAMSHDMRAPLNGIIGMAELAVLHKDDQKLVGDYVQKIRTSGKQLLTLINDILEMARLDNGKVEHVNETFAIRETVREIADIFQVQAELENKNFEQEIFCEEETVSGDLQSLHQILNNILSNALKYTKSGGSINFMMRKEQTLDRNRDSFTFIVKDTGCGMSDKFLEKIFEPFERDNRFGVPKVQGTGLGMAIVKSLVERLDGQIHITSRVDEGTCVIIGLPFNVVKLAQPEKARDEVQLADFAGSRILVAEDNDLNMEIISELLTMNGLEVVQACDGQEALEKFAAAEAGSISMILMDMQMPRLDGCEATAAIRALPRADATTVPIVALTGNSGSDDVEAAMQAGMNNYMVKPVKMKLLAKMLGEYLA